MQNHSAILIVPEGLFQALADDFKEMEEAHAAYQAAYTRASAAYAAILAHAGRGSMPVFSATTSEVETPALASPTAARADAEAAPAATSARRELVSPIPPAVPGTEKYTVRRGQRPTYADVVAYEVEDEIFTLEDAWRIIAPLLARHPSDWRHSLRRSLMNDREGRFVQLEGDTFGRNAPAAQAQDSLLEFSSQQIESAASVGALTTDSDDD